jgi:N-acetyl sugar amidotransferase
MGMNSEYRVCVKCVMDTSDKGISFDEDGVCSHCRSYEEIAKKTLLPPEEARQKLAEIVDKIKRDGKGKEYDCIIGLSGGIDSSYLAYQAKQFGLRPLAVHFDNGWNSEISVKNIENIVKKLGFDLHTYVIDWEEFKDLQRSFFKASVVDIELLTDNAIFTSLYKIAREQKIKYSLEGHNVVTESIMGKDWNYWKFDLKNIRAIQKQFGTVKIRSFPTMGPWKRLFYQYSKIIEPVYILNYLQYNKQQAMETLEKELGWQYYGGKHYESVFTKFYQAYVLPTKFKIDKRRAHLSNLICSNQLTREEALVELAKDIYPQDELSRDKEYVAKKLGFTEEEFDKIMQHPPKSHLDYPSDLRKYQRVLKLGSLVKKLIRHTVAKI